jgi:RNA polymerase sigma-70 factor (ECF subfamily)
MYRWSRMAGLQPEDAANVVQEAFAAVARKLGDFRRDQPGGTFRGWLRRIVENKIRDHYRQLGRRVETAIGGTDAHRRLADMAQAQERSDASDAGAQNEPASGDQSTLNTAVTEVRQQVGDRDWRFFWRVVVDGQSAVEVGKEFGVSANAVRLVKMRVLRRLRGYLGDQAPRQQE